MCQRAAQRLATRALIEIELDGATGRQWTYGDLLGAATRLAKALASCHAHRVIRRIWLRPRA